MATRKKKSRPTHKKKSRQNFADQMIERVRQAASKFPKDERKAYLEATAKIASQALEETGQRSIPILDDEGRINEAWLHIFSGHLHGLYIEKGEEWILGILPYWLWMDFEFFMGEQWLRQIFGDWVRAGEREKIVRALFGSSRKGKRRPQSIVEIHNRDLRICAAVDTLIKTGLPKTRAFETVANNPQRFGSAKLSPEAVRSIYEKIHSGYHSLVQLFSN